MSLLGNVLGGIAAPVGGYFRDKQKFAAEQRAHKLELQRAQFEARMANVRAGRQAEVQWNMKALDQAGWKDEYLTIVLSIPLILAFFPPAVPYLYAGFAVLEKMPDWYKAAVGVMIGAAFGYRKYIDHQMRRAYTLPAIGLKQDTDA